ncbi:MAG: bifunctional folylpolyglutamate synthase/dihydrofolate synthase [Chitinophagaceae bacterium]
MNYQQTIDYLFTRLPMFSRIGAAAIRKDLTNTYALCKVLGDPQKKIKTIHVAGTNGKGSTSHMIAAILQTAGYKTGLYTSPHLYNFRERIRLNGSMIPEQSVVEFTNYITPFIDQIDPSFFEISVAMAFDFFAKEQVDIAVIEVGLGGRLDSTNIIFPEVAVITNIGYDHMNLLGNTLQEIAFEKAGIIKKNTPVVIGEMLPETKPVFEKVALALDAPIHISGFNRNILEWKYEKYRSIVTVADRQTGEQEIFQLDLPGFYQNKNLLTVLEAIHQLQQKNWKIDDYAIKEGLSKTKKLTGLQGRWDLVHTQPDIILDVAHNEDGIKQLIKQLEIADHQHLHIVLGMVKDKEIEKILRILPTQATYYFTKAQIPRALPEEKLAELAFSVGLTGKHYPNVKAALDSAKANAHVNDLILVCGSVFVVGEVVS